MIRATPPKDWPPVFELELEGFNGATDETDHLIKWLEADDEAQALQIAADRGWKVQKVIKIADKEFTLYHNATDN